MVSDKKRQKELKRPDTFQEKALRLLDWGIARKNQILIALIPILVIAGGVSGWSYFQSQKAEDRREKLAQIDQVFLEEAEAAIKQQEEIQGKIDELNKKLKNDGKETPAVKASNKKELTARKHALEKQFKEVKPDHAASKEKFLVFYKAHSKTPEGWRAGLNAAGIMIENESYKEATEHFKELLPLAAELEFYNIQARTVYISLLEELGEYATALEQVDMILKNDDEELKPKFLLIKGRLQLLSGNKEIAKETFQKIVGEHNTSLEAQKAKAYTVLW